VWRCRRPAPSLAANRSRHAHPLVLLDPFAGTNNPTSGWKHARPSVAEHVCPAQVTALRVVTILRLRRDSSHSCPLSSRVVLADLTSPAAATTIATLAAVTSSGASYTRSRSYSPNGKPATKTLAPS